MSSYVGEEEKYGEKPTKGKDFYEKKRRLVPTGVEKELFENRPAIIATGTELTPKEIEGLEDYTSHLLLVGV